MAARLERLSIPEPNTGCTLWIGAASRYGRVDIASGGRKRVGRRSTGAHRLAWELVHGPIPDGLEVCHKCDVGLCINVDHLFLGTHADNMQDMADKQRRRKLNGTGSQP